MSFFFLVLLIRPAYNAEAFIAHKLNSVLTQTSQITKRLVVDDSSKARTAEIAESMAQRHPRVILLQKLNVGVATARNLAIKNSIGAYITVIDADDIWFPQKWEVA